MSKNSDDNVVDAFGQEWTRFNQSHLTPLEAETLFDRYFSIFPWHDLPEKPVGFDMGGGSGRWAHFVAPKTHLLHVVDASAKAIKVAQTNLEKHENCRFHVADVNALPFPDCSMDFGYSLGVLHHIPDTPEGLKACTRLLKPGAPFLLYLYYRFENRPWWFRLLWRISNLVRLGVSRIPFGLRAVICDSIAVFFYWPFARLSKALEKLGLPVRHIPLSSYRTVTFYSMRTDALDRFGTRIEKRFTANEIKEMMEMAGLTNISFSPHEPFWVATGRRTPL